ncbi:putative Amastin surface glycoprotein [Leishmania naiffi]|uniref:Amastin surface glycoprotein n=1 Tax=Leishmania naiffi TaxID=5678 RepID=A0AAW3BGK2_9TRYP
MPGRGNNVPQGHQQGQLDSDSESYTGSSGSYSDMVSEVLPRQQRGAAIVGGPVTPNKEQGIRTRGLQQSPSSVNRSAAEENQQDEGGETAQKKGRVARGREKARAMMNAAWEAPAARVRAVTDVVAGKDSQRVAIALFFCVSWVHLLFVILSATLSQIDVVGGSCYTFWGYKDKCDTVSYTRRTALLKNCTRLRSNMHTGSAFAILSILASTATVVTSWLLCIRFREADREARHQCRYVNVDDTESIAGEANFNNGGAHNTKQANEAVYDAGNLKKLMMIVVAFSLVCELICWAIITDINTQQYCNDVYHWSTDATYGVGFGLGLTAWLAELIMYVIFVVLV